MLAHFGAFGDAMETFQSLEHVELRVNTRPKHHGAVFLTAYAPQTARGLLDGTGGVIEFLAAKANWLQTSVYFQS